MGLDMYVFAAPKALITFFEVEESATQLYYWRKHPNLHGWMQRLYQAKGGQDPDFNCSPLALNSADLDALQNAIEIAALPETSELFFGVSNGSERDDLEFIRKAREALKDGLAIFYVAWW